MQARTPQSPAVAASNADAELQAAWDVVRRQLDRNIYAETVAALGYDPLGERDD